MKFADIKGPLWEATKEPLRLLVLAVISFTIQYLTNSNTQWAMVLILVLRFLDKLFHEWGKEIKDDNLIKGITRF